MRVITFLSLIMVVEVISVRHKEQESEQNQEFLNQLDYFGNVKILHSILKDYAHLFGNWTNPEYVQYDRQVITSLQNYVDAAYENNTYHDSVGTVNKVKMLTNFCGPGNWSTNGEVTQNPYFNRIDQCCKSHDECPFTIVDWKDYTNFPGLPHKSRIFTRLRCNCDAQFFSCLHDVATFFSYAVAWIYSKVQTFCFEYEYPVTECKQFMYDGLFSLPRCKEYIVDNSIPKSWQWFNVPYLSSQQLVFPSVSYRYPLFWYNFGPMMTAGA